MHGIWSDLRNQHLGSLAQDNRALGYSAGLEVGHRFSLNDQITLVPQAQITYRSVDFESFTDPYGVNVALDDGASLRGRLGLSLEHEKSWAADEGDSRRLKTYGIVNIYNEFLDGTTVALNGQKFYSRNEKLWGGLGIGGSYSWKDDQYLVYGEIAANTSIEDFGDSYELRGSVGLKVKW